jgi:hypothetical protein
VSGHDLLGQFGPPRAPKTHQILGADWDHPCVTAATGRAGQAIELFGGFRHSGSGLTLRAGCCQPTRADRSEQPWARWAAPVFATSHPWPIECPSERRVERAAEGCDVTRRSA